MSTASSKSSLIASLPPIRVHNVLAECNMGCKLDVRVINRRVRNTEFEPKRFANRVLLKLWDPKVTLHIFGTGKVTVVGARSVRIARIAFKKCELILRKLGFFDAKMVEYKTHQISAAADVGFNIRLEELAEVHADSCLFEADVDAGCTYSVPLTDGSHVNVKVFSTGKITFSGAKTQTSLETAYAGIMPVLRQFAEGGAGSFQNYSTSSRKLMLGGAARGLVADDVDEELDEADIDDDDEFHEDD